MDFSDSKYDGTGTKHFMLDEAGTFETVPKDTLKEIEKMYDKIKDSKRIFYNKEEFTLEKIEACLAGLWPKPGDPDYFGPLGNGWYQLGKNGLTNEAGWEEFQKAFKDKYGKS